MDDKPIQRTVVLKDVTYEICASRPITEDETNEILEWYLKSYTDSNANKDRVKIQSKY